VTRPFADRAIAAIRSAGSPLCIGLDPFLDRIPPLFGEGAAAVRAFSLAMVERAARRAPAVKPQLAHFERFGAVGAAIAEEVSAAARKAGLILIVDAKRGDIGPTAESYAEALYGPPFAADAATVNPYMGLDTLEPFVVRAEAVGAGVAVLVRTSNPGAKDFQDLDCAGAPLWVRVAERLKPLSARLRGADGWSGLMVVAGATYPQESASLRQILPEALFLVPGYGAQGAGAAEAVAGFVPGPKGREGGLVNASRSVLYPPGADKAPTLTAWRAAIDAAIDAAADDLAGACGG
jgi:orotidine-5'-phosphate decarboxylase